MTLDHSALVELGRRWFLRNGFPVVATELRCQGTQEQPDVIAFRASCSAIIEAKVSRSDFHADRKKPHRKKHALGVYRFYLAPQGVVTPEDLLEGWGLLHVRGQRVIDVVRPTGNLWLSLGSAQDYPEWATFQHNVDVAAERAALFSIARRQGAVQRG